MTSDNKIDMENFIKEQERKVREIKEIFCGSATQVIYKLLNREYSSLIDCRETLEIWHKLFNNEMLRNWLLFVLASAVDERLTKVIEDLNQKGIEVYYEYNMGENHSSCDLKLKKDSANCIFSFETDNSFKFSLKYSKFLKNWNEYVDLLGQAIEKCKTTDEATKEKRIEVDILPVICGGPKAMDMYLNNEKHRRLKKIENLMIEEFSNENNTICNTIVDSLLQEFKNLSDKAQVVDGLEEYIRENN